MITYLTVPDKFYPVQGSNKFETVSFPITKALHVDYGAQTTANATVALHTFPKGSVVLGFVVRVTETLASTAAATVQFGFTGKPMLTSAIGSGVAIAGAVLCPIGYSSRISSANSVEAYCLNADDTFDLILAVDPPSAGQADVFVTYVPLPAEGLSTSDFKSITTT